jgi:hypothetical protein
MLRGGPLRVMKGLFELAGSIWMARKTTDMKCDLVSVAGWDGCLYICRFSFPFILIWAYLAGATLLLLIPPFFTYTAGREGKSGGVTLCKSVNCTNHDMNVVGSRRIRK